MKNAEPAARVEQPTPRCSDVWHFEDAPCVCAEREAALLKDGWYIQEIPTGIAVQFVLWHQSPGYETGTLGSSKGHMEIDATVAFLLRKLAAPAARVVEQRHRYVLDAILDGDSECFVFEADSAEHFALQNRLLKLTRCGRFSYTIYSAELHQRPLLDLETYLSESEAASQRTEGGGQPK